MNTHINKNKIGLPKERREYLGVTVTKENYKEIGKSGGRVLLNFHKAHLKAYLKGQDYFQYGFNRKNEPAWFKVEQRFYQE